MSTYIAEIEKKEQGLATKMTGFKSLEDFTKLLNREPDPKQLIDTFDKKAKSLPISMVETLLDEIYLRQWGTRNESIQHVANEVMVTLTLWVIDPLTQREITRLGFAAVTMQWDAVPADLAWKDKEPLQNKRDRNTWNMDLQNKKQESLKMAFPKAKSMAIKNAAQSLGKSFGRDINRKHEDSPTDFYEDLINGTEMLTEAKELIKKAKTDEDFKFIKETYVDLMSNVEFQKELVYYTRKYDKAKADKAKQS